MKYVIAFLGILSITLITIMNFFPQEVYTFINEKFLGKEYILPKENQYYKDINYLYVSNFTDDVNNKQELLNYIYYVINTGSDYADGACTKEYKNCIKDIEAIAEDNNTLSILNNFVHPYNSFKTISFAYSDNGEFSLSIEHIYNYEEIAKINYVVDKVINEVTTEDMTKEEKVKNIHNYIIDHTNYDKLKTENIHDETYKSNTAYGVLIEGYGICSGYSDALAIFLNKLDLNNYKISNDKHIWNYINLNNTWLHIDATWDDPISEFNLNRDTYFLIDTKKLESFDDKTHSYDKNIFIEAK